MGEGLKKKVGPLPMWAWVVIAGGGLGALLLWRKSKEKAPTGTEAVPEHLSIPAVESAGGGLGGGGAEGKVPIEAPTNHTEPNQTTGTPVSQFLGVERELHEGGWEREAEYAVTHPSASSAPAVVAALKHAAGGPTGRGGVPYKSQTVKGHAAHVYARAVKGGQGPGKNIIYLGGATAKGKTHAAQPSHLPKQAEHKPAAHKPITRHGPAKRPAAKPKAKPKAKARR